MSVLAEGGCLCGALRYAVSGQPTHVTVCFCHFCQRATGSQGMVEPIFDIGDLTVIRGTPKIYTCVSEGSGHEVHVHFCDTCGTKTHLTFGRWPEIAGVYVGTFDDPDWIEVPPEEKQFIFLSSAAKGTFVPSGFRTYQGHSQTASGEPLEPRILSEILHIR